MPPSRLVEASITTDANGSFRVGDPHYCFHRLLLFRQQEIWARSRDKIGGTHRLAVDSFGDKCCRILQVKRRFVSSFNRCYALSTVNAGSVFTGVVVEQNIAGKVSRQDLRCAKRVPVSLPNGSAPCAEPAFAGDASK